MDSRSTRSATNGRSCGYLESRCRCVALKRPLQRPFPYPGHTHIPFTLERMCEKIPGVPQAERVDEAVILGKLTSTCFALSLSWADVAKATFTATE